jgi:hypothetical protein
MQTEYSPLLQRRHATALGLNVIPKNVTSNDVLANFARYFLPQFYSYGASTPPFAPRRPAD